MYHERHPCGLHDRTNVKNVVEGMIQNNTMDNLYDNLGRYSILVC